MKIAISERVIILLNEEIFMPFYGEGLVKLIITHLQKKVSYVLAT